MHTYKLQGTVVKFAGRVVTAVGSLCV